MVNEFTEVFIFSGKPLWVLLIQSLYSSTTIFPLLPWRRTLRIFFVLVEKSLMHHRTLCFVLILKTPCRIGKHEKRTVEIGEFTFNFYHLPWSCAKSWVAQDPTSENGETSSTGDKAHAPEGKPNSLVSTFTAGIAVSAKYNSRTIVQCSMNQETNGVVLLACSGFLVIVSHGHMQRSHVLGSTCCSSSCWCSRRRGWGMVWMLLDKNEWFPWFESKSTLIPFFTGWPNCAPKVLEYSACLLGYIPHSFNEVMMNIGSLMKMRSIGLGGLWLVSQPLPGCQARLLMLRQHYLNISFDGFWEYS